MPNHNHITAGMSSPVYKNRNAEFKDVLQRWIKFYDYNLITAIRNLRKEGYSHSRIAVILGISPANYFTKFADVIEEERRGR